MSDFVLFGRAHLTAIGLTVAVGAALAALVRRRPVGRAPRAIRALLLLLLAGGTAGYFVAVARQGRLSVWDVVPLQMCDFLILVAAFALATLRPAPAELLYFWACTGTLLAMVTPDLRHGFPDWQFLVYFLLHGTVVVAAIVVTFGFRVEPRPGAVRRVFLATLGYAAVVYAVDVLFDRNFLYLREKPFVPTLLDWMGPWPLYVLVVAALALGLFALLNLPFALARRRRRATN